MKFGFAILTYLSVLTNAKTDKVESTLLFCAAVLAMDLSNIKLSIEVQITQKAVFFLCVIFGLCRVLIPCSVLQGSNYLPRIMNVS
jgi:hypothetical protein